MSYFNNIGFNEINEGHIHGDWRVEIRFKSLDKAYTHFFESNYFQFCESGLFICVNGKRISGTWVMMREIEMIYNPLIAFFEDGKQIAKAIITRLITNASVYKLTLYFSTGLELILEKAGHNTTNISEKKI